ncbi:uncharacterized protein LOC106172624 isoform X1 [Lingula anatina]|uniref:Uncharacterized protein LOC106172624 isoform X1 n=1 Tax=Lingula anatina TaxID=7574 RepID=A0A1S3JEN3_LINAN|nr:uncharacterized protein LOC106172624 isoform X1 [Lingula anatina]|eukprot:XP_013408872.1 uncharacterized protein LOC106172624 isoform X1 [Lingula anatina]
MNRHFAVCVMLVAWSKSIAGELDPCDPSNHVLRKGEWRRSVNYTKESGEAAICDRYMDEGWYRFDSPAGNDIPTYCVLPNHCGTTWPIWMNGSLPTKNQEIDAIACVYNLFTIEDPCCYKTYNIKVKNCNDEFNVYYLVATDGCSQAYCVGTEVNCPLGEYSNNGFTPGCGPGKYLPDHVLKAKLQPGGISKIECAAECLRNDLCVSFNVRSDNTVCELNSAEDVTYDRRLLVDDAASQHYTKVLRGSADVRASTDVPSTSGEISTDSLTPEFGPDDPCNSSNHVLRKDEWRRSVNYTKASGEAAICDRYIDDGWYRFDSPAGNDMSTSCVLPNHCGTTWPIWMNGTLPTRSQEINAKACVYNLFSSKDQCCDRSYDIKVKNCIDKFNVYYLVGTDGCSQAYCVGTEVPCSPGENSTTGFTPGCV